MRKSLHVLSFLIAFLPFGWVGAQPQLQFVSPDGFELSPDTLRLGTDSILTYRCTITNTGDRAYSGSLFFYGDINGNISGLPLATFNPTINVNDTLSFSWKDTVRATSKIYVGGDNIIVVWPKADDQETIVKDSSQGSVYITGIIAIDDPYLIRERVEILRNPVNGQINLRYKSDIPKFEYVRVLDLRGRELFFSRKPVTNISLGDATEGIYFLDLRYRDGVRGAFRILNIR